MGRKSVESLDTCTRKSGILLHPTSFPGTFGIGDLGPAAYAFIDFLAKAGQKLWQVLPLGPTGFGDSPYQAFSSFAGQPLIISPEALADMGLLAEEDMEPKAWEPSKIDYGPTIIYKMELLRKAFSRFEKLKEDPLKLREAFLAFQKEHKEWLQDYALFMAAKDAHGGVMWTEWDREIAFPTKEAKAKWLDLLQREVEFYSFVQFIFFKQWFSLKAYANERGIEIIGDIPIFTAFDSADVWANKELFYLDEDGYPLVVAGVPPDYFSETGQLWGNPLYNWEIHKETGYRWWIKRVASTLHMVDYLRIDHFRGFEAYYAIPYGAENAVHGEWRKGPYKDLFYAFQKALGEKLPIIAEDLGVITPEVIALRDEFGFPGMKILQFGFDNIDENPFLPHNFVPHSVCYTGTHDNDTILGWYQKASLESRDKVNAYLNTDGREISWDFIRACFGSVSEMAIVPLQDVLGLDSKARMNTPGTTSNNWQWRYTQDMLSDYIANRLRGISVLYGRTER
ncbi:MAG: 4-alpha-glucanotransferase [Clostridiales bacterium]|jgi:4-alpha-glucanotransferase|nr:4-alpha-glucanotransferase [Clostridiales bacterium]